MKSVLGIDLGTQSLKVVCYDYENRVVAASASAPLEVRRDERGTAEQEADWWLAALKAALGKIPAAVLASAEAVAVSGQQHGFVAVDSDGAVLAPVKLWCDTSTQAEADEIMAAVGGRDRCIELAGNPVLVGYTASKIRWFRKHRPERYRKMAQVLLPHDFLNFVLTGKWVMEYGDASGTGLFDVRARRWCPELLQAVDPALDLADRLPPLVGPDTIIGEVTTACSREYGIPAGIPVAPGGGDNMMAAIGTGNVSPGRLTMSLGTSGTLFASAAAPVVDPDGNIAAFCSSTGGWLPLLCTMNCTFSTELMRTLLDVGTDRFDEVIGGVPAGSDGLLVLPFFSGERTPNLPRASASILGLRAHNCTRGHLLRATAEGATFGLRFGLDELRRLGLEASGIVLTGGGANSNAWCQIVADVCRLPVTLLEQDEGASYGAALQALWLLERRDDPSVAIAVVTERHLSPRPAASREPIGENADRYVDAYAAWRRAVDNTAIQTTELTEQSQ
ncbi:MAG TPA: xylulokinase [Woeseiaceae bacterium]|nr:xylulokinase [Woeseiaceae bacterium]